LEIFTVAPNMAKLVMHTKMGLCDPLRFISFNLCLVSFFKEIENIKTEI